MYGMYCSSCTHCNHFYVLHILHILHRLDLTTAMGCIPPTTADASAALGDACNVFDEASADTNKAALAVAVNSNDRHLKSKG